VSSNYVRKAVNEDHYTQRNYHKEGEIHIFRYLKSKTLISKVLAEIFAKWQISARKIHENKLKDLDICSQRKHRNWWSKPTTNCKH
jgi:hypothetical protein